MPDADDLPRDVFEDPPKPTENASSLIEERLSALEQKLEARGLSWEEDYRNLLIEEVRQRMNIRQIALLLAGMMLAGMLFYVLYAYWAAIEGNLHPTVSVALIVAPIVSTTTITAMVLLGAFRRFKDDDPEKISSSSLAAEALKGATGG